MILKCANESLYGILESEWCIYRDDDIKDDIKKDILLNLLPAHMVHNDIKKCERLMYDVEQMILSPVLRTDIDPVYQYIIFNLHQSWRDYSEDMKKEGVNLNKVPREIEKILREDRTIDKDEKRFVREWFRDIDFRLSIDFEDWDFDTTFLENVISAYLNGFDSISLLGIDIDRYLELIPNDLREQYLRKKPIKQNFYNTILEFKRFIEGGGFKAFTVTENPQEETGRTLIQAYLTNRGFREAEMGGGKCDLIYPNEEIIIETKIWRDSERFQDGIEELCSYLDAQGYHTGYYLLFDNTQRGNVIVKANGAEVFDINYKSHKIHCFFIDINPITPCKKRRMMQSHL